jgi:hypothetical protein
MRDGAISAGALAEHAAEPGTPAPEALLDRRAASHAAGCSSRGLGSSDPRQQQASVAIDDAIELGEQSAGFRRSGQGS